MRKFLLSSVATLAFAVQIVSAAELPSPFDGTYQGVSRVVSKTAVARRAAALIRTVSR
jgi:hypothetical protein